MGFYELKLNQSVAEAERLTDSFRTVALMSSKQMDRSPSSQKC